MTNFTLYWLTVLHLVNSKRFWWFPINTQNQWVSGLHPSSKIPYNYLFWGMDKVQKLRVSESFLLFGVYWFRGSTLRPIILTQYFRLSPQFLQVASFQTISSSLFTTSPIFGHYAIFVIEVFLNTPRSNKKEGTNKRIKWSDPEFCKRENFHFQFSSLAF